MTRAAIYARYSSDRQKATSIEDQIAMARRECDRKGWTVVEVFEDREMTGRNMRRPGLQRMKDASARGEIDVVVVEALDRLTRKVADALNLFDLYQFQGVELYSVNEGKQDFMRVMLLGFGAQEVSAKISVHTRRGMQGAISRGRLHTSAYGYRKRDEPKGTNREIAPEEARIVLRIFRETAEGRSAMAIAKGLNADGIPAPKGGTWEPSTIRGRKDRQEGILNNRLYIGEASVCKFGRRYHPETGAKAVYSTEEDMVQKTFEELRIIPQDLWDQVQAECATRTRRATVSGNPQAARRSKHLLSGLLVCDCCGAPYIKVGRKRFQCREARKGACNNKVTICQTRIEARVFDALRAELRNADLMAQFEAAFQAELRVLESTDFGAAIKATKAQLALARKARDGIMRAIEKGADFADYSARDKELKAEITALEDRIAYLEAQQAEKDATPPDIPAIFEAALQDLEALLGDPDLVARANEELATLVRSITLLPDPESKDGLAAEIHMDLGSLRSRAWDRDEARG
ncbi:recombinase family protein [Thioclava sp. 15-R06ZXC-3]|uniref:Recombinase family protein n=1 Tax=Thioclava arctica TaxID=3238301 RepID=A0ABV3TIH2_9RHOB